MRRSRRLIYPSRWRSRNPPNIGMGRASFVRGMRLAAVPRFYFNLRNDLSVDDEEGEEYPTLEAARKRAEQYALDMSAASVMEHHKLNLHHRIEIADSDGQTLLTVEFGDVVKVEA